MARRRVFEPERPNLQRNHLPGTNDGIYRSRYSHNVLPPITRWIKMYTHPTTITEPVESRRDLRGEPEMINTLNGCWAIGKAAFASLGSLLSEFVLLDQLPIRTQ